jgi:glutaminyl-tRNA synthetase
VSDPGTPSRPRDFLREIIDEHNRQGTYGGRVKTRFPPEPNGYLHIGHAKSICLNFGLGVEYGGSCNLRMDDTNPTTEDPEYVASIQNDVRWLGFSWGGFFHASDSFEQLYQYAVKLIEAGKAYVCDLSEADMRAYRGTVMERGKDSPFRTRTVEESLDLFRRMRAGEFRDGTHTLRARIDMGAQNMKMRDPPLYRIRHKSHYRSGNAWCIYPLYDFAHCLSDSIEGITHSICTLEFENNRELYDWILDSLPVPRPRPHQYEFARLNINYTVLSKRKLLELVNSKTVSGWDDPRMPTLSGLRRRGYTPEGIRSFCDVIGVAKTNSVVDVALLESCIRDDLNRRSPRVLCVLEPLLVTITNFGEGGVEKKDAPYFPPDVPEGSGSRELPFSSRIYIEREDFAEVPPKGWHRLAPGERVRLRHAYVIQCDEVIKDAAGNVTELRCSVDRAPGPKTKGTIHWVSAEHALDCEVRLYDRLFSVENPDAGDGDYKAHLNPDSLVVKTGCKAEPSLTKAQPGDRFQLERHGFFCVDTVDSRPGALVLNRTVALKDSWAKQVIKQEAATDKAPPAKPRAERRAAEARDVPKKELSPEAQALISAHGLAPDEARLISAEPALLSLFEEGTTGGAGAKALSGLLANELWRALKTANREASSLPFGAPELVELLGLLESGALMSKLAREVLAEMLASGDKPTAIVDRKGYRTVADAGALEATVDSVLATHASLAERYRGGETKLFGVLLGEVMKAAAGKANGKQAGDLLRKKLS